MWIAAALLGALTALLVWAFMKGFGWLNGLTLGTFEALPAPAWAVGTKIGNNISSPLKPAHQENIGEKMKKQGTASQ